ncbi:MAG: hypothetical protein ACRDHX_05830 [Chloroflexota bacterium]
MRTTVTLDSDVVALIDSERGRSSESFRTAVNSLIRRGARRDDVGEAPPLPELPGRPMIDVSDSSALLAALDDDRRRDRHLP